MMAQQLPTSRAPDVIQLAASCVKLQRQDVQLMTQVLERGRQLVNALNARQSHALSQGDRDNLVAMTAAAVAVLDMRELAADAVALVAAGGGFKQQVSPHIGHLRRLYKVHSWLQEHCLLDGRGLAGLVTEAQLQRGAQEAAAWDWVKQGV
jgi:hypothetical protein